MPSIGRNVVDQNKKQPPANPFEEALAARAQAQQPPQEQQAAPAQQNPFDAALAARNPQDPNDTGSAAGNFAAGANDRISQILGSIVAAVTPGDPVADAKRIKETGDPLAGLTDRFSGGTQVVKKGAKAIGINANAPDTYAGRLGGRSVDAATILGSLFAAAPAMAALPEAGTGSVVQGFLKELGTFLQSRPAAAILADIGANAGGELGATLERKAGGSGATGDIIGSGLGAGVVSGIGSIGSRLVKNIKQIIIPSEFGEPLVPRNASPGYTQSFSQDQVQGDVDNMTNYIRRVVEGAQTARTPAEASVALRGGLQRALRVGRAIESRAWQAIPGETPVPVKNLWSDVAGAVNEARAVSPDSIPQDRLSQLRVLVQRAAKTGVQPQVRRLLGLRSDLLRDIREELGKTAPNRPLNRVRQQMVNSIQDAVDQALPGDATVARAQSISKQFNNLFTRGPVGQVLRLDSLGAEKVAPEDTLSTLLRKPDAGAQIAEIAGAGARVLPRRVATTAPQGLLRDYEEGVRATFAEVLGEGTPGQVGRADKWLNNPMLQRNIRPLAEAGQDLDGSIRALQAHLDEESIIRSSAFAKFSAEEPSVAVDRILASATPAKDATEIMARLSADSDAADGFRDQFVKSLIARGKGDPENVLNILNLPKVGQVARVVLGETNAARFKKIAAYGLRVKQGKLAPGVLIGRAFANISATLLGAKVGRQLHSGSIQVPAITARVARAFVSKMIGGLPGDELMARAVLDPKWESYLYLRAPQSPKELKAISTKFRRLIYLSEGVRAAALDKLAADQEKRRNGKN